MPFIIAIDGPSVSGKSSVSEKLSQLLNISHLNSGNLYRISTYILLKKYKEYLTANISQEKIAQMIFYLETFKISVSNHKYYIGEEEVSYELRTDDVHQYVSRVASIGQVRNFVNRLIKKIIADGSYIIDGRDIGTVLCPNAQYKFYLTADLEVRARRYMKSRIGLVYEEEVEKLQKRDYEDLNRTIAPLKKASDAHYIDSTDMSFEEVVDYMMRIIQQKK